MTRTLYNMPTVQGYSPGVALVADATASVNLPIGLTYHRIDIECNAQIAAAAKDLAAADWSTVFGDIRLMVNGTSQITISAKDLVALNQFYGKSPTAGVLQLYLSRPWARTPTGEDLTAYGTYGLATFSLEMDIKAGQTVNSLNISALQGPQSPYGAHLRIRRFTQQVSATGEKIMSDLPRGQFGLMASHITTDQVGKVQVFANNNKVFDMSKNLRAAHYAAGERVPQAGYTHIDNIADDRANEALLMMLQDYRVVADFKAAGSYSVITEEIQGAA